MSLSITVRSTREWRSLVASGNTAAKLADNKVGSTGSWYSSTPFQIGKGMLSYSSMPCERKNAYKASIFSGFVVSPPPVRNTPLSFLILSFSSPYVSTVLPSSEILDGDLPPPHFWPGILRWCITVLFSSTVLFLMYISFMISCFPYIYTNNETVAPSDVLGDSLSLWGTTISSLNCFPNSPLTKALLSFMIEALIFCRNSHENMVLHAPPSSRAMENFTIFLFNTNGFFI